MSDPIASSLARKALSPLWFRQASTAKSRRGATQTLAKFMVLSPVCCSTVPPPYSRSRTPQPAEAVLQWPTNYTGFRVNRAASAGRLWKLVTNAVTVNGAVYNVSVSTTTATQILRLRKP